MEPKYIYFYNVKYTVPYIFNLNMTLQIRASIKIRKIKHLLDRDIV